MRPSTPLSPGERTRAELALLQPSGLNLLVLNRIEDAAREFAASAQLDPRDAEALAHLAYCELVLGRVSDARQHVDRALALNPAHTLATAVRAKLQETS